MYILKFSACLFAFIAFYKVFLEQTSYNKFKRYFLLSALFAAICIPFITFIEYIEPEMTLGNFTAFPLLTDSKHEAPAVVEFTSYIPIVLWSIYGLGVLIFSVKFLRNLIQIILKIKINPKHKTSSFINVLLQDLVVPHTFFSYIFLNKLKFENNEIPREVLLHEETHAEQKHSLDVLFIEALQILFWFNPLIYLIKKDIKLNHEFLADQAVIQQGIQPAKYQELLLAFSSNASDPQLANAINYSSIKKRLTVMKTQTKKRALWLRSLVLMPLLALLVYSFSSRKLVVKEIEPNISIEDATLLNNKFSKEKHTARSISIEVLDNGHFIVDDIKATKETLVAVMNTMHQDITPEVRNRIMNIHVKSSDEISNENVWFIYNSLLDYGFHRIVTANQEVIRSKGNTPFAIEDNIDTQKSASREQMAEYNKLAVHYNKLLSNKKDIRIEMKEVERMKYIYGLMSKKQRADAEPFPDFPKPPPAPKAPHLKGEASNIPPPPPIPANATPEQKKKYEKAIKEYKAWRTDKVIKGKVSENPPPPPPPIPANATPEQKRKYQKTTDEYKRKYSVIKGKVTENPPPPPPPKSPLDHVIDMAKKGAVFYINEKKVTSDQAIDALKKNKSLNVQTIGSESKKPSVYIQTKPIHIKNKKGLPKPTAENSVDHIKVMHRHKAKFYLNNTRITYREALAYVKKNRSADISTSMESNVVIIDKKEKQTLTQKSPYAKTGFINTDGKKLYYTNINNKITYYNRYGVITDKNGKELKPNEQTNASDVLPNSNISKVYQNDQIVSEFNTVNSNKPPETVSMLELLNKGAVFYFDGKEISGKKAIELTDNNKALNVLIKDLDSKKPIVKLSKEPIRI